jgi:hypothetical protein
MSFCERGGTYQGIGKVHRVYPELKSRCWLRDKEGKGIHQEGGGREGEGTEDHQNRDRAGEG